MFIVLEWTAPLMHNVDELGISVRKSRWGLGIASGLIDRPISSAKSGEVTKKIGLKVREDNLRAVKLYRRKEFLIEGRPSKEMCVGGPYYDELLMGIDLDLAASSIA